MNLKERLLNALPAHADRFITIQGSYLYVRDLRVINQGNATIDCDSRGIASVELDNPLSLTIDFDSFPDNALPLTPNSYESQCECVLFPEGCDEEEWILFIETKYVKSFENAQRREYGYPGQMVKQIKKTVEYFRNKEIIAPEKKVYAIISFPTIYEGYDSWTFPIRYENGETESIDDLLCNDKIHIRATNYATIRSVKRLKLAYRYVPNL